MIVIFLPSYDQLKNIKYQSLFFGAFKPIWKKPSDFVLLKLSIGFLKTRKLVQSKILYFYFHLILIDNIFLQTGILGSYMSSYFDIPESL